MSACSISTAPIRSSKRATATHWPRFRPCGKIHRTVTPEEIRTKRAAFREKVSPDHLRRLRVRRTHHAQTAYVRDVMRLDDTYDGRQRQMSFPEFRDDFFSVIGNDGIFGRISRIPVRPAAGTVFGQAERCRTRKPPVPDRRQHLLDGFQPGIHRFRLPHDPPRVCNGLSPVFTSARPCDRFAGRAHGLYLWKPFSLDYSYNFEVLNLRHGSFGNLTPIDNTKSVKNNQDSSPSDSPCR